MGDNKARMLGIIYLIFMTAVAVAHGFDMPAEPMIKIGSGAVEHARFSPDGRYLAVATSLGVEIRDADTREQLRFLPGVSGPVVFNHQTTLLVTGNGTIWDTADFTKIAELSEEQSIFAFTPDDRLLITGHWKTDVSVWDTGNWQKIKTYSNKLDRGSIGSLAISPDGKLLCASFHWVNWPTFDFIGEIIIWEVESGKEIKILAEEVPYPGAVAFSPDGEILATQRSGRIVLWETQTWKQVGGFKGGGSCESCSYIMEFQPGTRLLARRAALLDTDAMVEVRKLSGHVTTITTVSFHPNGKLLATVSIDGDMKLWDVTSGEEIEMTPYSSPVAALTFTHDSDILISCDVTRRTERYNLVTGERKSIMPAEGIDSFKDFSVDGSLLAVTWGGVLTIYDTDTGEVELSRRGRYDSAIFSHDGNTLVILAENDKRAVLWDIWGQKVITEIPLTNSAFKTELDADGKMLAVLNIDDIEIWDVATKRKKSVFPNNSAGYRPNMAFSNTGKLLAVNGSVDHRMAVKVWDVDKGEILFILDKARGARTPFAFSPDDKILATGAHNGVVSLWDMEDGEMIHLYREHMSGVAALEFSPDGKYLASGGNDGLIVVWEVNVGGAGGVVGVEMVDTALVKWGAVKRTALLQNYPNPFNPDTWIPYFLAEDSKTVITVYHTTGQIVRTLDLGRQRSGYQTAHWDGKDNGGQSLASGVYFYILKADDGSSDMKKMVLLK